MSLTNSQYDLIMRSYEDVRRRHQEELRRRMEIIYKKIPAYRELDARSSALGAGFTMRSLSLRLGTPFKSGDLPEEDIPATVEELRAALYDISEKKRRLLIQNGFSEEDVLLEYTCEDCQDTGYIGTERCHCLRNKSRDILYDQSNLRELIRTNNFSLLNESWYSGEDLKRFRSAVAICRNFISRFGTPDFYENLLFFGTVGSGKTFLTICTANEILKDCHSVLYFSSGELFDRLAGATFSSGGREALMELHSDLYEQELLIIDDLGAELTNTFVSSAFFTLINERDLRRRSTIINTNLGPEEIRARYSDRVFSRLMSNYTVCEMTSNDVRLHYASRLRREQ